MPELSEEPNNFEESYIKLVAAVKSQIESEGPIRLDDTIQNLFRSTTTPTNSDGLQEMAALFGGTRNKGLFLRLDGPAVFLIVATTLQFPYSSTLHKVVFFFREVLAIYKNDTDALDALRRYVDGDDLQKEVKRRRRYIFRQLIERLRRILFHQSMHIKVRRLAAHLILGLCLDNTAGWSGLMDQTKGRFFLGNLFRQLDDYTLRIVIADIIRHLRANNFDMGDIWHQTDEHAMDFPSSQDIDSKSIDMMLNVMSDMDVQRAFKANTSTNTSCIYRISDVNIPSLRIQSGRLDTLLVLDDSITIFMPDSERQNTIFQVYEIPIIEHTVVEEVVNRPRTTKISLSKDKGHVLTKGKKIVVEELFVEFAQIQGRQCFIQEFARHYEHLEQASWSQVASQQQPSAQQEPLKMSTAVVDLPSETEDAKEKKTETAASVPASRSKKPEKSAVVCQTGSMPSSDLVVGRAGPSSDVFGPIGNSKTHSAGFERVNREHQLKQNRQQRDSGESDKDSQQKGVPLRERLLASKAHNLHKVLIGRTPSSDESAHQALTSSSPLEHLGRSKRDQSRSDREGIIVHPNQLLTQDPPLTQSLALSNDQDFESFRDAGSKAGPTSEQKTASSAVARSHANTKLQQKSKPIGRIQKLTGKQSNTTQLIPKPAITMPKAKRIAKAASQYETSPPAKTSSSTLRRATKANWQRPANASALPTKAQEMQPRLSGATKSAAGRAKAGTRGKEQGKDHDTDNDIFEVDADPDDVEQSNMKPDSKKPVDITVSKKVLGNTANINRGLEPQTKAAERTIAAKAGKVEEVAEPTRPETQAPTRRSQRVLAKKAATYEDPSESEIDEENEGVQKELGHNDAPNDQKDANGSNKRRWASQIKIRQKQVTNEKVAASSKQISAITSETRASRASNSHAKAENDTTPRGGDVKRNGMSAEYGIVVPSSDPSLQSEDDLFAQPSQPLSNAIGMRLNDTAQTQSAEKTIVGDSYPKEAQIRHSHGAADQSFGAKLRSFAMITPIPHATASIQKIAVPFGDTRNFIQNVNGVRCSTSPVKEHQASDTDLRHAVASEELQEVEDGEGRSVPNAAEAGQPIVAPAPNNEEGRPLIAVQDESGQADAAAHASDERFGSTAVSQVDRAPAAGFTQIHRQPTDVSGSSLEKSNRDDIFTGEQEGPDAAYKPEAKTTPSNDQHERGKQSTAQNLEIADSQDNNTIDYRTLANELALIEAAPCKATAKTMVLEPVQQTAQVVDTVQLSTRDQAANKEINYAVCPGAQAETASSAKSASETQVELPASRTKPYRLNPRTPVFQASEMERYPMKIAATSSRGLKVSRKSNLIHFDNARPQNQGSPTKAEALAMTYPETRPSPGKGSLEKLSRRSEVENGVPTSAYTAETAERERVDDNEHNDGIFDTGDFEVDERQPPNMFSEATEQEPEPLPQPKGHTEVGILPQAPANDVREQDEPTEQPAKSPTCMAHHALDTAASTSRKHRARASEPHSEHKIDQVDMDTSRDSAPQFTQVCKQDIAHLRGSATQVAMRSIESSNQRSPIKNQAGLTRKNEMASLLPVKALTTAKHAKGGRPIDQNIANKRDAIDTGLTVIRGEPPGPIQRVANVALQPSLSQVLTRKAGHANTRKHKSFVEVPEDAANKTETNDNEANPLKDRSSMSISGSGAHSLAPASLQALASAHHVSTQVRSERRVNHQSNLPPAQSAAFPTARSETQLSQQQRAPASNPEDSPIDVSPTQLFSENGQSSESEQESGFEASAVDSLPLPLEPRRPTRWKAARLEQHDPQSSKSEEEFEDEQLSPPAKRRKTTKAQEIAQTRVQRPQAPDQISRFGQKQLSQAQNTISFTKVLQAGHSPALPFDLELTNVFGARDLSKICQISTTLSGLHLHGAHLVSNAADHQISAHSQAMPTRKAQSPKKTNMPPLARPVTKVDHRSMLNHNPPQVQVFNKEDLHDPEPSSGRNAFGHSRPTSVIKRVRQFMSPPTRPSHTAAPACTPQPFHERLHAATSPVSDADSASVSELRCTSHDHSDAEETTVVEPYFLLRNTMPQSPSAMSTNRDSEFSVSPEPEGCTTRLNNARLSKFVGTQPTNCIQRSLQQAVFAITQDVYIRLEHEQEAVRALVQRYNSGCTEMLDELKHNAASRLKHDATKLVKSTKELQGRITNTAEMVSELPQKDSQTIGPVPSASVEDTIDRGQRLLEMLDEAFH